MVAATQANHGRFLGIRFSDFGLFTSILLSFAFGITVFFVTCFVAIFGILIYNNTATHSVDFADSYRYFALPAGLAALAVSLVVLLGLWLRRKLSAN
jgi:hypothetical protein